MTPTESERLMRGWTRGQLMQEILNQQAQLRQQRRDYLDAERATAALCGQLAQRDARIAELEAALKPFVGVRQSCDNGMPFKDAIALLYPIDFTQAHIACAPTERKAQP